MGRLTPKEKIEAEAISNLVRVTERSPSLAAVLGAMFEPVHIQGGPCIDTAPEGEAFVPSFKASEVTCKICQVTVGLIDDAEKLVPEQPRPIADRLIPIHVWMGKTNKGGVPIFACGIKGFGVRAALDREVATCRECAKVKLSERTPPHWTALSTSGKVPW